MSGTVDIYSITHRALHDCVFIDEQAVRTDRCHTFKENMITSNKASTCKCL